MFTFLQGYRSYLISAAIFVVGGLFALGKISQADLLTLLAMLNGAGVAALRSGIDNSK